MALSPGVGVAAQAARDVVVMKEPLDTFVTSKLMGTFLGPAIAQAFSLHPKGHLGRSIKKEDEAKTPHSTTHVTFLHFTYDPTDPHPFTLSSGKLRPLKEAVAFLNETSSFTYPPDILSQDWLNKSGYSKCPPIMQRFAFVVSAAPAYASHAADEKAVYARYIGGTALHPPSILPMLDYGGVRKPEDWVKDLKARMRQAKTPMSREKVLAKKAAAAEELAEQLYDLGKRDDQLLWGAWAMRERWMQHFGVVSPPPTSRAVRPRLIVAEHSSPAGGDWEVWSRPGPCTGEHAMIQDPVRRRLPTRRGSAERFRSLDERR